MTHYLYPRYCYQLCFLLEQEEQEIGISVAIDTPGLALSTGMC